VRHIYRKQRSPTTKGASAKAKQRDKVICAAKEKVNKGMIIFGDFPNRSSRDSLTPGYQYYIPPGLSENNLLISKDIITH